jgi:flavin reductase (DIM6/NTAB) family NADH-FMN oxidoreductase RutF
MNDEQLIAAFEAGTIGNDEFPHERHVRVAWGLARRYAREEALRRLVAGIRGIASRAGRPDAYHETITRAWFELIAGAGDLDAHPELFDKSLLARYYTTGRLAAGRDRWLEPDLHPLTLPAPPPPTADVAAVLRGLPAAVAVLATRAQGTVHATTVSSVTPVSRAPALVSVCLRNGSRTLELVRDASTFALSVLASDQREVAAHFAARERPADRAQFAGVRHHLSAFGPVLEDAAALIGCELHAVHPCGDHHIVVGDVRFAEAAAGRHPLLYP